MAIENSCKVDGSCQSGKSRRYTISELLVMGKSLPYVCCPIKSFKPEAWTERILISVVPTSNLISPRERLRIKIINTRLELHRPHELISRQQNQGALNRLAVKKKPSVRGAPLKQRVMPTIPEVSSIHNTPKTTLTVNEGQIQPASLADGLSGGYGKKIETSSQSRNGLIASMHAFVPGGTLKTAPVTAVDASDTSSWGIKENFACKTNTLSLGDGLGSNRTFTATSPAIVATAAAASSAAKEKPSVDNKVENTRYPGAAHNTANSKVGPPKHAIERPRPLMAKRSTSNDQMAWIEFMMKKPIISASREAPQIKEALGASIDNVDGGECFKALDDFHKGKKTAGPSW